MNTFLITSTINSDLGVFSVKERLKQTEQTIASIRKYAPDSKILFIDNSNVAYHADLDVDFGVSMKRNIFTRFANRAESKGLGEAYMISEAFDFMRQNVIRPTRLFKISGRYRLAEGFDIKEYDDPKYKGMYTFRINDWDVSASNKEWYGTQTVRYYETRLYSMCGSLMDEYEVHVNEMFETMITSWGKLMNNWEMCHCYKLPEEKIVSMKPIYVEGENAVNGVYRFE